MKAAEKEKLKQVRYARLDNMIWHYKKDLSERLAETRKLFGQQVYAVDIHTHSTYSDGLGTVEENYQRLKHAGLDFFFATDHGSLRQKRVVRRWADASWGQEPGAGAHHIGLLCNKHLFRPRSDSIAADFQRAKKIASFVWIPHPAGWYPGTWYTNKAIETLWTLGPEFPIEVMNGAHKIVRAYDAFDAKAVTVWDQLLCDGKKIAALGGSDAHGPDDIGSVWTGIFAPRCTAPSIIKALNEGHCFASEASLLDFSCNSRPMGSTLRKRKDTTLKLRYRVADAAGIASIRIISQGSMIREVHPQGQTVIEDTWTRKVGTKPVYYRLESSANDDRRAFSTPIYVEPAR